jgi:type II secretory pathway pseudopilin PulG
MLVVIVILGILMSLAVVGVSSAMRSSKVTRTEAMIEGLAGVCETYQTRWGDYPPTTLGEFKIAMPNETNNGAEALTACLASTKKGTQLLGSIKDDMFVNIDQDSASGNITGWFFGDFSLREISDAWGYPIAYFHAKDYQKASPSIKRYKFDTGGPEYNVEPAKSAATRTFLRSSKFQIMSVGPDGKPGTADDIQLR